MRKLVYKRDITIIVAVVLVAVAGVLFYAFRGSFCEGHFAVVELRSEEIYRIDLDKIENYYKIYIDDGCEIELEVQQGRIRVAQSSCPDKLCVNCGWLENVGDTAVCLPNRLVVHIASE